MKIKELINQLKSYDENEEILISGDPEGNDFRTIDEVATTGDKSHIIIYPTDMLIEI